MDIEDKIIDHLFKEASANENQELLELFDSDEKAKDLLHEYEEIFKDASTTPLEEPDADWVKEMANQLSNKKVESTSIIKVHPTIYRIAATAAIFIIALLGYNNYQQGQLIQDVDDQLFALRSEMANNLNKPSVSTRIKAVRFSDQITNHNSEIIDLLTHTMMTDQSAHVRLAAVQSLSRWADSENVKVKMIEAMGTETDPSVQISLIETLGNLNDKNIAPHFDNLINNENTPQFIKEEAHKGKFNLKLY